MERRLEDHQQIERLACDAGDLRKLVEAEGQRNVKLLLRENPEQLCTRCTYCTVRARDVFLCVRVSLGRLTTDKVPIGLRTRKSMTVAALDSAPALILVAKISSPCTQRVLALRCTQNVNQSHTSMKKLTTNMFGNNARDKEGNKEARPWPSAKMATGRTKPAHTALFIPYHDQPERPPMRDTGPFTPSRVHVKMRARRTCIPQCSPHCTGHQKSSAGHLAPT